MTGTADSTPSTARKFSTYFVLKLAGELVKLSIVPGLVKMISALKFCERRCKSLDIPRASPVNSMTRATPNATPTTLTSERMGRWRMLAAIRLSIKAGVRIQESGVRRKLNDSALKVQRFKQD